MNLVFICLHVLRSSQANCNSQHGVKQLSYQQFHPSSRESYPTREKALKSDTSVSEITAVVPKKVGIPPKIARGPSNTTSYLNERVELSCKVLGTPPPKVRWESQDYGDLSKVARNYRVHKNGSLIFREVTKRDESKYRCIATNTAGEDISKWARLTVDGININWGVFSAVRPN